MNKLTEKELDKLIHDIRNPLNSITLNAELGKVVVEGEGNTDKIKQILGKILQQSKRCDEILIEVRRKHRGNPPT